MNLLLIVAITACLPQHMYHVGAIDDLFGQVDIFPPETDFQIVSKSDNGNITITGATKNNVWDNDGNSTIYRVSLISGDITDDNSEIRVGIEWATAEGLERERVVFYATKATGVDVYRLDYNLNENGQYSVQNKAVVALPKDYDYLSEDMNSFENLKFKVLSSNIKTFTYKEGSLDFVFSANARQSFGDNLLWINWGVFNGNERNENKVQGPLEPYLYQLELSWTDLYVERSFVNIMYVLILVSSLLGPASFIVIIPCALLLSTYFQVLTWFIIPFAMFDPNLTGMSFSFINYVGEFVLKWNGLISVIIPLLLIAWNVFQLFVYLIIQDDTTLKTDEKLLITIPVELLMWVLQVAGYYGIYILVLDMLEKY